MLRLSSVSESLHIRLKPGRVHQRRHSGDVVHGAGGLRDLLHHDESHAVDDACFAEAKVLLILVLYSDDLDFHAAQQVLSGGNGQAV